jgi:hypothetical protein
LFNQNQRKAKVQNVERVLWSSRQKSQKTTERENGTLTLGKTSFFETADLLFLGIVQFSPVFCPLVSWKISSFLTGIWRLVHLK